MEHHTNKKQAPEIIKVPLQSTTKTGRPIFAYLRRSTTKDEQRESLLQQEEGIERISKECGYQSQEIRLFTETKSGFENRKRPEWRKMLKEIDSQKEPVILLCRDTSRLSRNPTDNLVIANRIFGDNKTKKSIGNIFFLGDGAMVQEWNDKSDKKYIVDKLHQNYIESLETKTKSVNGHILKLEAGIYPYNPAPRGLEHTIVGGIKILKQNDKMPFVRRAFEMKVERQGHKAIVEFLKKYGDIKISDKELTDRYFTNLVYIGEYTEKNTGEHFTNLHFLEGKPPISLSLWNKVQVSLAKRGRIYRSEEERDIFEKTIRIEDGTNEGGMMCRDPHKGINYYKSTKHKINISEKRILHGFIATITEFMQLSFEKMMVVISNHQNQVRNQLSQMNAGDDIKSQIFFDGVKYDGKKVSINDAGMFIGGIYTRAKVTECFIDADNNLNFELTIPEGTELLKDQKEQKRALEITKDAISVFIEMMFLKSNNYNKEKSGQIKKLSEQKDNLEKEKKDILRNALKSGYSREEISEILLDIDKSIITLEGELDDLNQHSDMDKYMSRLPDILSKIVELGSNTIYRANIGEIQEDLRILFELTVSNGKISKEKELKIKLFEVLDRLISSDVDYLEAPSGVEPDYKALQASA